jgi:hypothetical protein
MTLVAVKYWVLVLVAATFASVPWVHRMRRFSLRTLLIAMTLAAAGLGMIVAFGR